MYGSQEKILGQKVNVKFFKVDPYSGGTRVPRTFSKLSKIQKNIFLTMKTSKIKSEKIYIKQYAAPASFLIFFGFLLFFLYFSRFFENLNSILWKNYNFVLPFMEPNFAKQSSNLRFFQYMLTCFLHWKNPKT